MRAVDWQRGLSALRFSLAVLHLGVWVITLLRPNIVELVPSYDKFSAVMPTGGWGGAALVIGLGLLFIPRGRVLLVFWQFASAVYFILFSILVTLGPSEVNFGTVVYGVLGLQSIFLAYLTLDDWMWHTRWPQRLRGRIEHYRSRRDRA